MSRRVAREQAVKMLYCKELNPRGDMRELPEEESLKLLPYAVNIVDSVLDHLTEIDDQLRKVSKNWKLVQMNRVDLAILRVAMAEFFYLRSDERLSKAIIINEAVEIARTYSGEKAVSFVNGILEAALRNE